MSTLVPLIQRTRENTGVVAVILLVVALFTALFVSLWLPVVAAGFAVAFLAFYEVFRKLE